MGVGGRQKRRGTGHVLVRLDRDDLLVGAIVSFLATLLPESVTKKIPLILIWLLPILAMPYLVWDLRRWWFHP